MFEDWHAFLEKQRVDVPVVPCREGDPVTPGPASIFLESKLVGTD